MPDRKLTGVLPALVKLRLLGLINLVSSFFLIGPRSSCVLQRPPRFGHLAEYAVVSIPAQDERGHFFGGLSFCSTVLPGRPPYPPDPDHGRGAA